MADFRTDLINELRNQKYYLEQDFVRLVNSQAESYKGRLNEIKDVFVEIGKINTALALAETYLPIQQQEQAQGEPAPAPQAEEGDVVTADNPQPAPALQSQPLAGQTHGE